MASSLKELYESVPALRKQMFEIMYNEELTYQQLAKQLKMNPWTVNRFLMEEEIVPDVKTLTKIDKWVRAWQEELA